ncbi:MAG: hypothetical protein ACM31L_15470 [Actinomycetota bacterium]
MADPRSDLPAPDGQPVPVAADQSDLSGPEPAGPIHEMVALFGDARAMEAAVHDLLTNGFDQSDISMLAAESTVRNRLGHRIDDSALLADDPAAPRRTWSEPESRTEGRGALASMLGYIGAVTAVALTFATGGAAAAAIGGALVGAGGGAALGAGLGRVFDQRLARELERQIQAGGILLWVRCRDQPCQGRAAEILSRHGAHHVHTNALA